MCLCCLWLVLAPRVLQLCTNHFVWVVCRPVWVNEACQLFLIPSWSSNTPLYPSKCCELGSVPRLLPLLLSSTWTHIWVLQGVGSASLGFPFKWCDVMNCLQVLPSSLCLRLTFASLKSWIAFIFLGFLLTFDVLICFGVPCFQVDDSWW